MKILNEIKDRGIKESLLVFFRMCSRGINSLLYYLCWLIPLDDKMIIFESEGDLSDNSFALYTYMLDNGYFQRYKAVWAVNNPNIYDSSYNIKCINKFANIPSIKRSFYLAKAKYFFYDHNNIYSNVHRRPGNICINLWHGCGFKVSKNKMKVQKSKPDEIYVTGKLYYDSTMEAFDCAKEEIYDIGYPRNDLLLKGVNSNFQVSFKDRYKFDQYRKLFLWMPTFRRSNNAKLSEEYFDSITGLPIIDDVKKLDELNDFLKCNNSLCIFKMHHLQMDLSFAKKEYSNFIFLTDEEIKKSNLQLYQVVPMADCLITDYSSIANDFMLLNRPIIYTVDDYEEYKNSRGFIPDDPIKYFAGHCVKDQLSFFDAMQDIIQGKDPYEEDRKAVISEMHTHNDGNTCERIVKHLNL